MSAKAELSPGLGRVSAPWLGLVAALLAVIAVGVFAYSRQFRDGMIVTHLRTIGQGGAAWGLYISFDVYFIGISFAGISTAALVRLFDLAPLRPLTRIAEMLTLVALPMGGLTVLADLGRPLQGLLYLPRFARPMSPFFGTFTLVVAGYLFASLVYFYLAGRADAARCAASGPPLLRPLYRAWASGYRDTRAERARHLAVGFWLAIFVLPLLVTAHSTLGFVFGIQGGRPGWYSALQAPAFVVLAGASGIGMLIIVAAVLRRALDLGEAIPDRAFAMLGNFTWVLTVVYLYFMVVEELTANYASGRAEKALAHEIVLGRYAPLFWIVAGCLVLTAAIGFVLYVRGRVSVAWLVTAGVLVNVAAILKRILIVVPSQTDGLLIHHVRGRYVPSATEISIVLALFALATLLYVVFVKAFPIVPLAVHDAEPEAVPRPVVRTRRDLVRKALFASTLALGLTLVVAGFLLCLRVGTLPHLDPVVPFSPLVFIAGVMLSFYSAAVYETLPPEPPPPATAG